LGDEPPGESLNGCSGSLRSVGFGSCWVLCVCVCVCVGGCGLLCVGVLCVCVFVCGRLDTSGCRGSCWVMSLRASHSTVALVACEVLGLVRAAWVCVGRVGGKH
jgi:hypothetical protein